MRKALKDGSARVDNARNYHHGGKDVGRLHAFARASAIGLAAAVALAVTPPAWAISDFGAVRTVARCGTDFVHGRGIGGARTAIQAGHLRGFVSCSDRTVRYIDRDLTGGAAPVETLTPFAGDVTDVAADASAVYALVDKTAGGGGELYVARRDRATGDFSSTGLVSGIAALSYEGALAAHAGHWTATWTDNHRLWVATDTIAAHAVSHPGTRYDDIDPDVAYRRGVALVTWRRVVRATGDDELKLATVGTEGIDARTVRHHPGYQYMAPSISTSGDTVYLAWSRNGYLTLADNSSGAFKTLVTDQNFSAGAADTPMIVATGRHLFAAWQGYINKNQVVVVAEKSGSRSVTAGSWTRTVVTRRDANRLLGNLTQYAGHATVIYQSTTRTLVRSQS